VNALLLLTLFAPAEAEAAPAGASETASAEDPAAETAQELYSRGRSLYGTSDYQGAIDAFTEAFISADQINDDQLRYNVNSALTFNLARAHVKAYGNDREPAHLRKATDLLDKYLGLDLDSEDRQHGRDLLDETRTKLDAHEAKEAKAAAEAARVQAAKEESGEPGVPLPQQNDQPTPDGKPGHAAPGLRVGGFIGLGVGVVGVGVMGVGMMMGNSAQQDYEAGPSREDRDAALAAGATANAVTYAGAAVGAVGLIAGGVMLGIAAKKNRRGVAATPVLAPGFAGASLSARF
jgi:tetratricopeptide (TPR) repeat protein